MTIKESIKCKICGKELEKDVGFCQDCWDYYKDYIPPEAMKKLKKDQFKRKGRKI